MDQTIRKRLNEIHQKQLESHAQHRAGKPSKTASDKSQLIAALGGAVAGLVFTILVWLANSLLTAESDNSSAPDTHAAIHTSELRKMNEEIELLNDQVVMLNESIASLEGKLIQMSNAIYLTSKAEEGTSADPIDSEGGDKMSSSAQDDSRIADTAYTTILEDNSFVATHIVKTRLNLRPSRSTDNIPIALLVAGTGVKYLDEENGWYFVETERYGEGWCASEYLSPLPAVQE